MNQPHPSDLSPEHAADNRQRGDVYLDFQARRDVRL